MKTDELFLKLLRYVSITPDDDDAFVFIKEYLKDFEIIEITIENTKNIFLYKRFSEGPHLCFAGHIDVVPAGEGWDTPPFEPTIKEGVVYARGAQDMKSGVSAFLQACGNTEAFCGTLSILLTSDEEGDAKHGTIEMLKALQKRHFLPDFAIVAEPTCDVVFGDAIKVGRRGSINGVLEVLGKQGHAAYPEKARNPVHLIAPILEKLAGHCLDAGDENFAPSQLVITDIRGGMEVSNVTPGELKIMFNVRNSTKTDIKAIQTYIESVMGTLEYRLSLAQSAHPFVTAHDSKVLTALCDAIYAVTGVNAKLSTAGGTSDARFFGAFGVPTVEFGVVNDTIHAPNECCPLASIEALCKVFEETIKRINQ